MCSRFASGFAFIRERYQIAIINRAERRFTMITVIIVITTGLWINVTNDFPSLLVSETFIWVYHRFTLNRLDIYAFSLIIFPSIKFPRHKRFLFVRFFAGYESIYYFFWQFFFYNDGSAWTRLFTIQRRSSEFMPRFSQATHRNIKSLSCVPMRWKCFYCSVGAGIKWIYQR